MVTWFLLLQVLTRNMLMPEVVSSSDLAGNPAVNIIKNGFRFETNRIWIRMSNQCTDSVCINQFPFPNQVSYVALV